MFFLSLVLISFVAMAFMNKRCETNQTESYEKCKVETSKKYDEEVEKQYYPKMYFIDEDSNYLQRITERNLLKSNLNTTIGYSSNYRRKTSFGEIFKKNKSYKE